MCSSACIINSFNETVVKYLFKYLMTVHHLISRFNLKLHFHKYKMLVSIIQDFLCHKSCIIIFNQVRTLKFEFIIRTYHLKLNSYNCYTMPYFSCMSIARNCKIKNSFIHFWKSILMITTYYARWEI